MVESKRGGGGYIRIAKVAFSDKHHLLNALANSIGEAISSQVFDDLIQQLYDQGIISEREGNIILASSSDDVLGADAARIRARMLKRIIQRVDRKGNLDDWLFPENARNL